MVLQSRWFVWCFTLWDQEVWKVSTTAVARRVKKGLSIHEASSSYGHSTKESDVTSKLIAGPGPELRRTSSFDRTWEESLAESVANELVLQAHSSSISSSKSDPFGSNEQFDESSKNKSKEAKPVKSGRSSHEDKKVGKTIEEKKVVHPAITLLYPRVEVPHGSPHHPSKF